MEKQDILDYVSKTPENANVNVLSGMLDELTSGGGGEGGGDSDFSIANVTFACSVSDKQYTVTLPHVISDRIVFEHIIVPGNTTTPLQIPLYKGMFEIDMQTNPFSNIDGESMPVTTGGVSLTEDGLFITGDGTFTAVGVGTISD